MARKDALALGGQAELGFRNAGGESFLAADVPRVLELARVYAQVAVRRLQELLELSESHAAVDAERAHDPQAHALVNQSIVLAGLAVREIARHCAKALRVGCRRGGFQALQYGFSRH